jgi:hypothetical protein
MAVLDAGLIIRLLLVNGVAAALLASRWSDGRHGVRAIVSLQARWSRWQARDDPDKQCGLVKWDDYSLVSARVVLPDGVRPATGASI